MYLRGLSICNFRVVCCQGGILEIMYKSKIQFVRFHENKYHFFTKVNLTFQCYNYIFPHYWQIQYSCNYPMQCQICSYVSNSHPCEYLVKVRKIKRKVFATKIANFCCRNSIKLKTNNDMQIQKQGPLGNQSQADVCSTLRI